MLDSCYMGSHDLLSCAPSFRRFVPTDRDEQKRFWQGLARTLLEQRRLQHDGRGDESDK